MSSLCTQSSQGCVACTCSRMLRPELNVRRGRTRWIWRKDDSQGAGKPAGQGPRQRCGIWLL